MGLDAESQWWEKHKHEFPADFFSILNITEVSCMLPQKEMFSF